MIKTKFHLPYSPLPRTIKQQSIFYALQGARVKVKQDKNQKKKQGVKAETALAFQDGKRYTVSCRLRDEDRILCDLPV